MRPTPDALMLFAAGFGTRMGALTANRPKPLIKVAGRALIDHALALVAGAGIGRIVANTHYLADQIAAHLAGSDVRISHETTQILETGGGLRHALTLLGPGPVFTLNTDAVWSGPNPITELHAAWTGVPKGALLLLVPPDRALGHHGAGDFSLAPDGRIRRGTDYIYTGAQIIDPSGLQRFQEFAFSLNPYWDELIDEGRAYGVVYSGKWCDVGRPESIVLAEGLLEGADG